MAWTLLKSSVDSSLPTNGVNYITAAIHRALEYELIDKLGSLQFKGVAVPATNPGSYDGERMFIAVEPGTYTNFDSLVVGYNELAFLASDGLVWTKHSIPFYGSGVQPKFLEFDNVTNDYVDIPATPGLPDPTTVTEESVNCSIFGYSGGSQIFYKNVAKASLTRYQFRINFASQRIEFKDAQNGKDLKFRFYNYYESV